MISIGLPKVTLGEVRLPTIALGARHGDDTPKPPKEGNYLLLEGGDVMLLENGGRILI